MLPKRFFGGHGRSRPCPSVAHPKRKIVVLEATPPPKGTTEYIDQVVTHADPQFEFRYLTTRAALRHTDVFHVHWPELIVRGRNRVETLVRCIGLRVVLALMHLRGTAVVRTLHNLEPHERASVTEQWAIERLDASTDLFVCINPITRPPAGPAVVIPHGHYRESFAPYPKDDPVSGRIVFAGLIRPYKGVENLIAAFRRTKTPGLTLRIVGKPTDELRVAIESEAALDSRVSVRFGYLPDQDFVAEVASAELVCLPANRVHNSGSLLAALSLDRPVLVQDTPTSRALAAEVGSGWVQLFTDELTAVDIDNAVQEVRARRRERAPQLDGRDWTFIAQRYGEAFIEAMQLSRQRYCCRRRVRD